MAKRDPIEEAADELYGLPPGEFTRARDARVKEVQGEGDREAAAAIKELRKPTVAAWALNQLARQRSDDVQRLVNAGEALRAAQDELLAGGDRAAFQEAANGERELVADLSAAATAIASDAGERGSGLQEKVSGTLHAAALDEAIARELRAGRLVREHEAIGGFGGPTAGAPARGGSRSSAAPTRGAKAAGRQTRDRDVARQAEQRQRVSAAMTDERHARRDLDEARRALQNAQQRADAAAAHAAEAAERARATAERLKEAKRNATAAQKAHKRASGALESAERGSSRRS